MKPKGKQARLIKFIECNYFITTNEAVKLGINPMTLSRLTASETVYRLEHGVYTTNLDWLTHPLKKYMVACTRFSKGVICNISALTYYDLTDEEERQIWIAVPPPQTINNSRYRVIRPTGSAYTLGIEKYRFGKRVVRIYNLEKTIVDSFKYNTEEIALKALKNYLKRKNKDVHKLIKYSRTLAKPLDKIITVLMADE